jgi:C4-dicarboxylate-specific signal transduction histidine kinase
MKRFSLVAALAMICFGITFYWMATAVHDRVLAESQRTLTTRAQFLAHQLDRTMQQRMVQTFTFAAFPSLRGVATADEATRSARMAIAYSELQAWVAADPNVRAVSIVNSLGIVILATDATINTNWGERVFVRQALAGQLYVSPPVREWGELSQYYSAPIINNLGEVAGALIVRVDAQELWSVLETSNDVMLIDENGVQIANRATMPSLFVALSPLAAEVRARILAEKQYGAEITQIGAINLSDLATAIKRGQAAFVVYRDAQAQTWHAAIYRMKTKPWTVVVVVSEETQMTPARDAIVDQFALAIIVAVLVAGTLNVAWFILKREPQ